MFGNLNDRRLSSNKFLYTEKYDLSSSTEVIGANLKIVRLLGVKSSEIIFFGLISSSPSNI